MVKVITYGTYDLLHYGHIRLLERAKALGDYLIVGVTADSFDLARGKINVQQSLMERIEAVKATGLADEVVVEEYEGQKIDDIKRYDIDIFTVGSDWKGQFDYLNEFCKVVYLDRTEGISSTEIRSENNEIKLGLVGESSFLNKFLHESLFVNGVQIVGVCTQDSRNLNTDILNLQIVTSELVELLTCVDAIYIISHPSSHFEQIKMALNLKKHVMCESPRCLSCDEWIVLEELAREKGCVLMDAIRTAYSTAFSRLILLAKSGSVGKIVSIDATCTSMANFAESLQHSYTWNSICTWGPTTLLPIFSLLGTEYRNKTITTHLLKEDFDSFTKIAFIYPNSVASIKVGKGVKSEGELIVSGTKGYIYVPAPWWKTDYFEIRFENPTYNRRYFYQLDGEGIRYELVTFLKAIRFGRKIDNINDEISQAIVKIMEDFFNHKSINLI